MLIANFGRKQWQEGAIGGFRKSAPKPQSPLHAVSSFVQSPLSTQELEQLIIKHGSRANSRIQGFQYFHQLLSMVSYSCARHQLLSCLGPPISNGGHYLDNIPTCGPDLTTRVVSSFTLLFEDIIKILRDR